MYSYKLGTRPPFCYSQSGEQAGQTLYVWIIFTALNYLKYIPTDCLFSHFDPDARNKLELPEIITSRLFDVMPIYQDSAVL